jgi:uncharacterized protein (DUF2249 family)
VIQRTDRVSQVLARDERLVEVFIAVSPHFGRLRSAGMRRVMTRLVTVEQAARVAGVDPRHLVERLNRALDGFADGDPGLETPSTEKEEPMAEQAMAGQAMLPGELAGLSEERIVDLDVRDDLRNGREPFSRIMAARQTLRPDQVLRLRAIFEPAPLYRVMGKQGFSHWTERLAADDWRVWFYRGEVGAAHEVDVPGGAEKDVPDETTVVLDVRGLEPPEPMVRTLAALRALPEGGTLVQVNERVPQFLLPKLEEAGFDYEIHEQDEGLVRVLIRRRQAAAAG